ncbi:DF family (seleno)protein [Propioniciclava sinopodophylli]|uniref:DF family (seleno)protein n=1 Tax=Propioniciclava sinopodophylli TaxID=1837344 RepID=UPI0024909353|nr:thioredoxin family protein [Propioniciclava sinopodophylli]
MNVTLLYFEECPNWKVADQRLSEIASERPDVVVTHHRVETVEEAERLGFHGSPSILLDGVDVFAEPGASVGLSCRIYRTADGSSGAPTMEMLRVALGLANKEA